MVFYLFGLQWVMPKRFIYLFAAWQGSFGRHRNIAFWEGCASLRSMVPLARAEWQKF